MTKDITQEIRERQEQINKLRKEIEELKEPHSIKKMMKNRMLDVNSRNEIVRNSSSVEAWEHIRKGCLYLFRYRHYGANMTIKTLTRDEVKIVAQMADEMVLIWNKYIEAVYGRGEINADG